MIDESHSLLQREGDAEVVSKTSRREIRILAASVAILVLGRLWAMWSFPLFDTTEARYGELARVTADGGFWLMPHMTPTNPFLAKPPLSTWFAALSWKLLGESEFALRFPSFLLSLVTAWLVLTMARDAGVGRTGRWMAAAMLATAPIFLSSAGAVMTDATQLAVVTGAMMVSWRALREPDKRRWRILFWSLLGVATLAKGLATLALIGLPIIAYTMFGEGLAVMWRRFWDPMGALLATMICLGWYVPAELAYPGFLKYFLIGEHFQRFLQPGWSGDRYGHAQQQPLGMIWPFWVVCTGIWLPLFIQEAYRIVRREPGQEVSMSQRWLWCWVLAPLVFFSASRNIIMTYTLTAIPPFAVIVSCWAESNHGRLRRMTPAFVLGTAVIILSFGASFLPQIIENRSARQLVSVAKMRNPNAKIIVRGCYEFSSIFYTRGTATRKKTIDKTGFAEAIRQPGTMVLVSEREAKQLRETHQLLELARNPKSTLFEVPQPRISQR